MWVGVVNVMEGGMSLEWDGGGFYVCSHVRAIHALKIFICLLVMKNFGSFIHFEFSCPFQMKFLPSFVKVAFEKQREEENNSRATESGLAQYSFLPEFSVSSP